MVQSADGGGEFEAWFQVVSPPQEADEVPLSAVEEGLVRRWFEELYRSEGPLDRETVAVAFLLDQMNLAEQCVRTVLDDVHRTTPLSPIVNVTTYEGGILIRYTSADGTGGYCAPSMWKWFNPDALAEVADYLQEYVMEDLPGVWPTCPTHPNCGLHPGIQDDDAIWICGQGQHRVATIGRLAPS